MAKPSLPQGAIDLKPPPRPSGSSGWAQRGVIFVLTLIQ